MILGERMEFALTPDTRRHTDTGELADAARAAGFSALGMVTGRVDETSRAVLSSAGLRCHELLGLQVSGDPEAVVVAAGRLAADAEAVGATWILTTFSVGLSEEVAGTVAECAALFADAGAGLAVEFSPLGPVATIADALDVIAVAGADRAAMVIDSWNFCLGSSRWEDLETVPLDAIAYVQFADALEPRGEIDLDEAMTRRALPGEGVLELERFSATLRERGWDGIVSAQVLSDDLRELPIDEFAGRVHDATTGYWS